jgi:hypothetical protein
MLHIKIEFIEILNFDLIFIDSFSFFFNNLLFKIIKRQIKISFNKNLFKLELHFHNKLTLIFIFCSFLNFKFKKVYLILYTSN